MSLSNFKHKLKGAVPTIGLIMTATGLVSVIYWNYLNSVSANAKEALSIGNSNKADISEMKGEMKGIKEDTKYIRERLDSLTQLK